MHTEIC